MDKKELIKHCHYYKGEEQCPARFSDGRDPEYWRLECAYVNSLNDEARMEFEDIGDSIAKDGSDPLRGLYASLSRQGRGILAYIVSYATMMQPYAELESFLSYGKVGNSYRPLLLYYKGEDRNPYRLTEVRSLYRSLERIWIEQVSEKNKTMEDEFSGLFIYDFPDLLNGISSELSTSLKGFLYDRYCHAGGTAYGFPAWFRNYIESAGTGRRRPSR